MVFPWKYSKIDLSSFIIYVLFILYPSLGEEVVSSLDSFQGGNGGYNFLFYNGYANNSI